MVHRLQAVVCFVLLLVTIVVSASSSKLPECRKAGSVFDLPDIDACKQEIQLIHSSPDCQENIGRRCCTRIDWILERSCQCWSGLTESQRVRIGDLATQCAAQGFSAQRGAERTLGVKIFVGVLTAGKNKVARQAIRDTWGSDARLHRVLFFSAKPTDERTFDALRKEAAAKGDIVVLPTIWESYYNITHQTLEVLRAAAQDVVATHVLKVDDDSYVRVDKVLSRVKEAPNSRMFMGFIENPGGGPHRNRASQWYVTPEEWPSERYPPWAHGAGYVITQDLVREIAAGAAMKTNDHKIFKLEDIAVGSWIEFVAREKKWEINYVMDNGFNYNGCSAYDVVSHYVKPKAMRCSFKNGGACCTASSLAGSHLRGGGT